MGAGQVSGKPYRPHPVSRYLVRFLRFSMAGTCLLVTFVFVWMRVTRRTYEYVYRVGPGEQSASEVAQVLRRRAANLRRQFRVTRTDVAASEESVTVRVETSFGAQRFIEWLTRPAVVQLRLVHPDPEILERAGKDPPPDGYEVRSVARVDYMLGSPGETRTVQEKYLMRSAPELTLKRFRSVTYGTVGVDRLVTFTFGFEPEDAAAFRRLSSSNVGRMLAFCMDEEVLSVGRIAESVEGDEVQIRGYLHIPDARRWAALLDGGALTSELELISDARPSTSSGPSLRPDEQR
jgi:preprotein translocase subunit SecD